MPAAHRPLEGDEPEGDLLWEARFASGMLVNLSGKSALVRRCLPLHYVQDGTSPSIAVVSLRILMWLVVPSLTFDVEAGARVVAKYLVSPRRLGVALDAIIAQMLASLRRVEIYEPGVEGGANSGPSGEALESNLESSLERMHVSVLRENMAKAAKLARRMNQTAFTVQLADLESLHEEEVDEGTVVEVFFPPWANFLVFSMLTSASGSAAPLAEAELLLFPRFTRVQRLAVGTTGMGSFFRINTLIMRSMPGEERALLGTLTREEQAAAYAEYLLTILPLPNAVVSYTNPGAVTLLALIRTFSRVQTRGSSTEITVNEIQNAVPHFTTLYAIVGSTMPAAAAYGCVRELLRVALGDSVANALALGDWNVDLGKLGAAEAKLEFLKPLVEHEAATGLPPAELITLVAARLNDAKEDARVATLPVNGGGGGSGSGGSSGAGSTYNAGFMTALRVRVASRKFSECQGRLEQLRAEGAKPVEFILAIFQSRDAVLLHALLGQKSHLALVPQVEWIAAELRPHFAQWCRATVEPRL